MQVEGPSFIVDALQMITCIRRLCTNNRRRKRRRYEWLEFLNELDNDMMLEMKERRSEDM